MCRVPPGAFLMGSDEHYPEERPAHGERVAGFLIDEHAVTDAEFRRFVKATGYVTTAETAPLAEDFPEAASEDLIRIDPVEQAPERTVRPAQLCRGGPRWGSRRRVGWAPLQSSPYARCDAPPGSGYTAVRGICSLRSREGDPITTPTPIEPNRECR
jgi:formylglycine-generating enzyme required for sulfatase activity